MVKLCHEVTAILDFVLPVISCFKEEDWNDGGSYDYRQITDGIGWLKKSDDDKSHDLLFTSLSRD
jgi:hypothetical protein